MKKFVCVAAAAVLAACAVTLGACSEGTATVQYTLSEDGTYYTVSGVTGSKRALREFDVPATYSAEEGGQALPVTKIGNDAFAYCTGLTRLTLPDGITEIGERAFIYCAFSEIVLPESLQAIKFGAFGSCERLTEVTVPQSVTTLGALAFSYCSHLQTANVKANITVLENKVFYNTVISQGGNSYTSTALKTVYLPKSVQKIHSLALYGNFITDIYFEGTEEEWKAVYFFETVEKEDGKGTEEKKLEKSEILPDTLIMHFNSVL